MIHASICLMNGDVCDLSLTDGATILDVKQALPGTYPWQVHLFPYECDEKSSMEALSDDHPVSDEDTFRAFMNPTDTRIFYLEKGVNPLRAINNDDLLGSLSVYDLETGTRIRGTDLPRISTPHTEYYLDMESINEWSPSAVKQALTAYLRMRYKAQYKGTIDSCTDRYRVYRANRDT